MCLFLDTDNKESYTTLFQMITSLQARGLLKDPVSIPFHSVTRLEKTNAGRPGCPDPLRHSLVDAAHRDLSAPGQ